MDWRHLEATHAPAVTVPLSEVQPSIRDFTQYLGAGRQHLAIVPLLLRRDPETGAALPRLDDVAAFARAADDYEIAGFAVATEPDAYGGRLDDLTLVARAASAPVLRYDCITDEARLYESRAAGADAVLVPVAAAGERIARLVGLARAIHVAVVAEVSTRDECALALSAGTPVIALATGCLRLAAEIPRRVPLLAVEEVAAPTELAPLRGTVDAVLVGRAIFAATDPLAHVAAFAQAAAELATGR